MRAIKFNANTKSKVLTAMNELSNNVVQQAIYSNQINKIVEKKLVIRKSKILFR